MEVEMVILVFTEDWIEVLVDMFEDVLEGEIWYLQFEVWRRRYIQELSKAGIDMRLGLEILVLDLNIKMILNISHHKIPYKAHFTVWKR